MVEALPSQAGQEGEPLALWLERQRDRIRQELKELALIIEQSKSEVNRLGQRSSAVLGYVQQLREGGDRSELVEAYEKALEAQQRYLIMRGQLEKMESDQAHLERLLQVLEGALERLTAEVGGEERNPLRTVETIIRAQEEERRRLSRQMHDGPAQALSNFILQTDIALRLFDRDPEQARAELDNLKHAAAKTFQQVREFIFELRPMMLDDLGLVPTVKRYLDTLREQSGVDIRVNVSGGERRLASYLEVFVFRAVQELVGNAIHHGQASQVQVYLELGEDMVRVRVEDNGAGFDTDALREQKGMGLALLRERVEMLGGSLKVTSTPGQGTQVSFEVPAAEPTALADGR